MSGDPGLSGEPGLLGLSGEPGFSGLSGDPGLSGEPGFSGFIGVPVPMGYTGIPPLVVETYGGMGMTGIVMLPGMIMTEVVRVVPDVLVVVTEPVEVDVEVPAEFPVVLVEADELVPDPVVDDSIVVDVWIKPLQSPLLHVLTAHWVFAVQAALKFPQRRMTMTLEPQHCAPYLHWASAPQAAPNSSELAGALTSGCPDGCSMIAGMSDAVVD